MRPAPSGTRDGMSDPADASDARRSPAGSASEEVPVPRIGSPAAEAAEESTRAERDAVGDGPDQGGLTPPDDAQ